MNFNHNAIKEQVFLLQDFHSLWQSEEFHYAKSLLLIFLVSHLIVVS